MTDFSWRAADAGGKLVEGRIDAGSPAQAMQLLRQRGLLPLRIDATAGTSPPADSSSPGLVRRKGSTGKGPVATADVLAITSELSVMLRAGLSLDNALRVLVEMGHRPPVSEMLQGILDDVKGGKPLSRALENRRKVFGDFYISMIRSGELSGQISIVMERLVEHMERLRALRENVISASIYPAILLGVAILSMIGMLGFVVPQFEKLFVDMGDALPMPTRLVMGLGRGVSEYGVLGALMLFAATYAAARWLRSPSGRQWWQSSVLRLPILGPLLVKYELTLFSRSLGTLLGNGVPMVAALNIATETVGNIVLKSALTRVTPLVKSGTRVFDAMSATQVFEPLAINLMRVGEETGRMGTMMIELANILNRDVETGIKRGLTLIEPALIVVLGLLIGAIIVSILLGILSINDLAV